jgi:rubrerythrin
LDRPKEEKMDIYDYAMQVERDGEDLYRYLAGRVVNQGLRTILLMLADAEVRHYKLFQNMKNNDKVSMVDTSILNDVKNIFLKMKEEKSFEVDVSHIELYRKAQKIEKMTQDFYEEKAGEVKDKAQAGIFLKIAQEEKRHYFILENIINFVNKPGTWLENPEWYHMEEY